MINNLKNKFIIKICKILEHGLLHQPFRCVSLIHVSSYYSTIRLIVGNVIAILTIYNQKVYSKRIPKSGKVYFFESF